ncbi:MAG TPA: VacB/RNase II family 3'-5' exoribonuclease [Terriglobales bacterium]|nr:VacB/RNase II family 3'-5' exoribonuclease [Terriglobales bacterium]
MRAGDADDLIDRFVRELETRAPRPLTIDELVRIHAVEQYDRKHVRGELEARVAQGVLRRIGKTRYQWRRPEPPAQHEESPTPRRRERTKPAAPAAEGHYSRVRAGYGFVEVLDQHASRYPRDILIPAGSEGPAMHGDRVRVEIIRKDFRRHRFVGRVSAVTERRHERMIGTLRRARHGWLVVPENELLPTIALVGQALPSRDQEGLVARIRLVHADGDAALPSGRGRSEHRPRPPELPEGELEEVLGAADDPQVQFLTIAAEHGLRVEFDPATMAEAERLPADPDPGDYEGREDMRDLPFVTIDGETARDFDDAVCVEHRDGGFRVWVAIADVSHYVRPGSALDREAGERGTSVYFPDRAIPMLPHQLSSQLCSLLPNTDRLVMVAEMDYDAQARRQRSRFYPGVIRSHARLTYTQVAATLDLGEKTAATGEALPAEIQAKLTIMHRLMGLLYRRRVKAGSLDMDLPEAMIELSEEGRSIGVRTLERNDAHRIIEELMLEANRAVAEYLGGRDVPLPYRIHEPPHADSIEELNLFLGMFGFHVDFEDEVEPQDVQRALKQMQGHRLERVLTRQLLRSLTKAHYSTRNAGHFGLAFTDYCHFTSPIRRYPDLLVHRQLRQALTSPGHHPRTVEPQERRRPPRERPRQARRGEARGESSGDPLREALEAECLRSSQAEREAMEAERSMVDLKKAELMQEHLHQPETGTVISVTDFGLYVELDKFPIEGLVRLDDLIDDRYRLVEEERSLRGIHTNRRIRLGDRVDVECIEANTRRRTIDFHLLRFLDRPERVKGDPTKRKGQRAATRQQPERRERRGKRQDPERKRGKKKPATGPAKRRRR